MTHDDAAREIERLSNLLREHQHAYYVLNAPRVSDIEYDGLFDRLQDIEREFPDLVRMDSPTQRVGSDIVQALPEVAHTVPVLSLDKAYTIEGLLEWMAKTERNVGEPLSYVLEEKIDGSSIVLYYTDGVLQRAVTRGNGFVGNDVTGNIRTIGAVPLRLTEPVNVAVRGEIYLPKSRFKDINSQMGSLYANPRNLAAGTLRRVKSSEVAHVPLAIFIYEGHFQDTVATHVQVRERLEHLGFRLNERVGHFSETQEDSRIKSMHPEWHIGRFSDIASFLKMEQSARRTMDYDIDGVVAKVNEIPVREVLGYTGHHPRWSIAFKFESPEGLTRITGVEVQVGRTGRVTPVARVEPVRISGSTISNVTLHNQDYIDMLDLSLGDRVAVSRRGDVIPAVERVIEKNEAGHRTWKLPPVCPACGNGLRLVGSHHFCGNDRCPAQIRGRLHFFCARGQMDIENLGPETLDFLVERGFVEDVSDIYSFDFDRLHECPGFGEKKIHLIKEGVEKSKYQPYHVVLRSLGIPEVGQKATELLIEGGFTDIDSLYAVADQDDSAPLVSIHGIGEKIARLLIAELSNSEMRRRIGRLRAAGLNFRVAGGEQAEPADSDLAGQVWCVTGTFEAFKPRDLAKAEIKRRGGRVTTDVTSKTTHLLAGSAAGAKLEKARRRGIAVVDEKEFLRLLKTNAPPGRQSPTPR